MNYLDVIIPVKDRELSRIKRCVNLVSNCFSLLEPNIIVVDYSSNEIIKLKGCKVIRIEGMKTWNKSHALNLGIKNCDSEYIMTLDVDTLLSKEHGKLIEEIISNENFIVDTNVRRIKKKDYRADYKEMIKKSLPWSTLNRNQLFNSANGGFQLFSRKFYNKIGGIMEGMGFYSGGMDNWVWFMARINGLNIVDISYPLLHLEHKKQKEENFNLSKEELDIARGYKIYKAKYLDQMIKKHMKKNTETYGNSNPCSDLFDKFMKEYNNQDEIIRQAVEDGINEVEICGQLFKLEKQKPSVLISIINNYESLPNFFVWDLLNLYIHTKSFYPDVCVQQVNACDVTSMRNLSVNFARGDNPLGKRYDYLVCLDTDHKYPKDFIVIFIELMEKNKWKVLTGLTPSQKPPHNSTQYFKIPEKIEEINNVGNCVPLYQVDKQIKIEASGPVGMVMNTNIFEKIPFPYYFTRYELPNDTFNSYRMVGSDIWFSERCKEQKIEIICDLNTIFPHWQRDKFYSWKPKDL